MAIVNRYARDSVIKAITQYGTARATRSLRRAQQGGSLRTKRYVLTGMERLDILAGRQYGDGRLWWVIAAASGIGWALQCPPGTVLYIPTDLAQIKAIVG